jgi:toxin ParE1/3/4
VRKQRYHPKAESEVIEAASYIEHERPGYGGMFLSEVDEAVSRLAMDPFLWPIRFGGYRKYTIPHFKHQIWYRATDDEIYIAAVAHPSRKPDYWKKRISDEQR